MDRELSEHGKELLRQAFSLPQNNFRRTSSIDLLKMDNDKPSLTSLLRHSSTELRNMNNDDKSSVHSGNIASVQMGSEKQTIRVDEELTKSHDKKGRHSHKIRDSKINKVVSPRQVNSSSTAFSAFNYTSEEDSYDSDNSADDDSSDNDSRIVNELESTSNMLRRMTSQFDGMSHDSNPNSWVTATSASKKKDKSFNNDNSPDSKQSRSGVSSNLNYDRSIFNQASDGEDLYENSLAYLQGVQNDVDSSRLWGSDRKSYNVKAVQSRNHAVDKRNRQRLG